MIGIPGSASGVVLGVLLASIYGAAFHLLFGGPIKRIVLYLFAAWLGFFIGQFVGDFLNLELLKIGKIHLVSASVGAWVALFLTSWLVGQETARN
jgi:hypothetical protein